MLRYTGLFGLFLANYSLLSFAEPTPVDWENVPEYRVENSSPKAKNTTETKPANSKSNERNNAVQDNSEPVSGDPRSVTTETNVQKKPEYSVKLNELNQAEKEFNRVEPKDQDWDAIPEYKVDDKDSNENTEGDFWENIPETSVEDPLYRARGPKFIWVGIEGGIAHIASESEDDWDIGINFHYDIGNKTRTIGISYVPGVYSGSSDVEEDGGTEIYYLQGHRRSLPFANVSFAWGLSLLDAKERKFCRNEPESSFSGNSIRFARCEYDQVFPLGAKLRLEGGLGKFVGAGIYFEATVSPDITYYSVGFQVQYGRFN